MGRKSREKLERRTERSQQKPLIDPVLFPSESNTYSSLNKIVAGAVVSAVAIIGLGGWYAWNKMHETSPPSALEQTVQQTQQTTPITFEQARDNESLRQAFIDQQSADIIQEMSNIAGERLVDSIEYDPELQKKDLHLRTLEQTATDPEARAYASRELVRTHTQETSDETLLGITILSNGTIQEETHSRIYLTRSLFEEKIVTTEGEAKSVLYHEALHALFNYKGIPLDQAVREQSKDIDTHAVDIVLVYDAGEVTAYDLQIKFIKETALTVRPEFMHALMKSFHRYITEVRKFAQQTNDTNSALFAKLVLDSLHYTPEKQK